MEVKVLGTGCANCKNTYALIERTAKDLGVKIQLTKVEAVEEIMQYGVATTPAVVIAGVVIHAGGVPSTHKVREWLSGGRHAANQKDEGCCSDGQCATTESSASTCCSTSETKAAQSVTSSCSSGTCGIDVGAKNGMGTGALVNLMAGVMILLGLLLAHLFGAADMLSISWLWLPAFVGLNLIQFAFTGFCPAKSVFEKLGIKKTCC